MYTELILLLIPKALQETFNIFIKNYRKILVSKHAIFLWQMLNFTLKY